MNTNTRGFAVLAGIIVFAILFCVLPPFVLLPGANQAVTLPVISVPAEKYLIGWPDANLQAIFVNTFLGGAGLATIIVLIIALNARRVSKGWTNKIPNRWQGFYELIVEAMWGLTKSQAGTKPKVRNLLFPLVASLFLYLLAGNLGKLIPGVETVGVLHCAAYEPVAFNGFPVTQHELAGRTYFTYNVNRPLNVGTAATSDSFYRCEAMFGLDKYAEYLPTQLDPFLDKAVTYTVAEGDTLESIVAQYNEEVATLRAGEVVQTSAYIEPVAYQGWAEVVFTTEGIFANNPSLEVAKAEGDHSAGAGEAAAKVLGNTQQDGEATPEGEATPAPDGEAAPEEAVVESPGVELAPGVYSNSALVAGQTLTLRSELLGYEATTLQNQLFTVTPFVRGMTTDLSFTLGLAILAFLVIQAFGISELGLGYFQKFINIRALGNLGNKPLGAIDFIVGIFEIVSEFGKIISLSFRLFGALFAGTVLFAVIMFLVGTTVPAIILLLEFIVGTAQAGVFAILTLIFSAQAMVSHHHDDEEHHDGDHAEAHH